MIAKSLQESFEFAVNEALRYDTPSHWVARTTTRDVEVAGTTIPAGDWVLLLLGSANRDERQFPDVDALREQIAADRRVADRLFSRFCV